MIDPIYTQYAIRSTQYATRSGRQPLATKLLTGNEALALGALHAGIKVATGYPGTPSTGALTSLLEMQPAGVHVEWSTNEKVAFEIAAAAAWAGQRALCTMKMSGLNVAYDSLVSTAHSGVIGGLVIYVADDPGANAGMVEQDSRGFALMSDLPMLDPVTVQDAYDLTRAAFDLSEAIGSPVFVRLVTANASSFSVIELPDEPPAWPERQPVLIRDINKFTKAGAVIAMTQHRDVIAPAGEGGGVDCGARAERIANQRIANSESANGDASEGRTTNDKTIARTQYAIRNTQYAIRSASSPPASPPRTSTRRSSSRRATASTRERPPCCRSPACTRCRTSRSGRCCGIATRSWCWRSWSRSPRTPCTIEAQRMGWQGAIIGKLSGHFERVGEYGVRHVVQGLAAALDLAIPADLFRGQAEAEKLAAAGRSPSARAARTAAPSWRSTRPCAAPGSRRTR